MKSRKKPDVLQKLLDCFKDASVLDYFEKYIDKPTDLLPNRAWEIPNGYRKKRKIQKSK